MACPEATTDALDRQVAETERRLIRQAALIARLLRNGCDTTGAQAEYAALCQALERLRGLPPCRQA